MQRQRRICPHPGGIRSKMNNGGALITGVYEHLDSLIEAVKDLRGKGHNNLTIYTPVPNHEIDEVLEGAESAVGYYSLTGGILGWIVGLALTVGTAIYLPLIVGGKPIVSFIPFYVIGFELTILLGGLFTVIAFLALSKLPRSMRKESFNQRFAEDRFGIAVRCSEENSGAIEGILRQHHAEEVSLE